MEVVSPNVGDQSQDSVNRRLKKAQVERQLASSRPLGPNGEGWPTRIRSLGRHQKGLPIEIFEMIGALLPRDSVQNMRLVNQEFEEKISRFTFKSVVVPFEPKIYGTITTQPSEVPGATPRQTDRLGHFLEPTYNATNHVRDGMRVFEEWGPLIKRFALTFEATEDSLAELPWKMKFENIKSFWGSYNWPHPHYTRFENVEILEQKADEIQQMTTAFSKLKGLRELGLSVLSCLGWLAGRDISDRARLLRAKPVIFGSQYLLPDQDRRESLEKWQRITESQAKASERSQRGHDEGPPDSSRADAILQTLVHMRRDDPSTPKTPPLIFEGKNIEYTDEAPMLHGNVEEVTEFHNIVSWTPMDPEGAVVPIGLSIGQEEWLMEIQWAQSAFLCSWTLAILDNPIIFHSLHTLNIANLSSTYLTALQRDDLWQTFSGLETLIVLVSPDWRHVYKHDQGHVTTELINPSAAQGHFYDLLSKIIRINKSIRTLKVGYVGGGEHATGMFARNQNILPSPLMREPCPKWGPTIEDNTIHLPQIEHLNLTNCWITPLALKDLFARNAGSQNSRLKSATFDSVSLTAHHVKATPTNVDDLFDAPPHTRWLYADPTPGSWSDVINTITPHPDISHARRTYDLVLHGDEIPSYSTRSTTLDSFVFNSCGYVRLPNHHDFDQSSLPTTTTVPRPACLDKRYQSLAGCMLSGAADPLLGTIVPAAKEGEQACLWGMWGMEFGWGEREERLWNREDGVMHQGGTGRFSGVIRR
ncbi:MAG: hypothetical protein Q9220_000795 [cf. Caloplaca sp. 1 TL-2023]